MEAKESRTERIQISMTPSERKFLKELAKVHERSEAEQAYRFLAMALQDVEAMRKRPVLLKALEVGCAALVALGDVDAKTTQQGLRRLRSGDQLELGDAFEDGEEGIAWQ